ncbi:MAG TPA: hypothetical protein VMF88_12170 [Bacteroidota bacterium]|nr:hypothetical protein [Bacteroidota bacterium]
MKYLPFLIASCALLFSSCAEQQIANPPPSTYELKQNYPNPFTDSTVIEYGIPDVRPSAAPWIRLVVVDRFNQTQAILVDNGAQEAGNFKVTWYGQGANGFTAPAGVYYIELDQLNFPGGVGDVFTLLRIAALKQ